ncbi:nucleotidyltransferase [Bacterioplanes sanyensis]|uniref:Nucleotidyltransferase n=1 Tax=Bacterioplanes sanyensis TaxID=1249553 RepID=A0A222FHQ2_9GAMM|nr:nucleotidyltransferase domain-containing protein [Bacterioplanes sanyensis]ASP38518.1 nucleotidyltransferase [Bacterioplanes sanyensis]
MKTIALSAAEELARLHQPDFIILYGSIARGDATASSDIDIACFCLAPDVKKDHRLFDGVPLDAWLYASHEADASREEFLRFVGGELLLDQQGQGQAFLQQLQQRFEQGPDPLSVDERQHIVAWSHKMLQRSRQQDIESLYRRHWLLTDLLEFYFKLRQRWFLGSKAGFYYLQQHDAEVYELYQQALQQGGDAVLQQLVQAVVGDG